MSETGCDNDIAVLLFINNAVHDGIYLSRVMKPQLVTWQQNTRMLGRMAADKLVQMIEHPRVTLAEQSPVTGKLLEGGSVRSIE